MNRFMAMDPSPFVGGFPRCQAPLTAHKGHRRCVQPTSDTTANLDTVTRRLPVEDSQFDARCIETLGGECFHRLYRQHAIATPAVGSDLSFEGQLVESLLEIVERDRHRTGDVP